MATKGCLTPSSSSATAISQLGESALNIVFTGLILVGALLFFPEGIVGSLRKAGRLPAFLDWD